MQLFLRFILLFFLAQALAAEEILYTVPGDEYATIEEALEGISSGIEREEFAADTTYVIEVEPGTYSVNTLELFEDLSLRGKVTSRTILTTDSADPIIDLAFVGNITIENFTFFDANLAIQMIDVGDNINIQFNVFNMGVANTAILFNDNAELTIKNNTFYKNGVAIDATIVDGSGLLTVVNNIFSGNTLAINPDNIFDTDISYSCLFNNINDGAVGTSSSTGDPLFVHAPESNDDPVMDFHLKADSACIDVGDGSDSIINDSNDVADAGAFGGSTLDKHPYPVLNILAGDVSVVNSDATSDVTYSLTLTWDPNESYVMQKDADTIGNYTVYYAIQSFTKDDVDAGLISSQVAATTSTTITDIVSNRVMPSSPTGLTTQISNQLIALSWDSVNGAIGYYVYYGLDSTNENVPVLVTGNSFDITDVVNDQVYQIAVTAVTQETLYFTVAVRDAYVNESYFEPGLLQTKALSEKVESGLSDVVFAIPEGVIAYPALVDKSCFIENLQIHSDTELDQIRAYRDEVLNTNIAGELLVELYYFASPLMTVLVDSNSVLKKLSIHVFSTMLPVVLHLDKHIFLSYFLLIIIFSLFIFCVPIYWMVSR